MRKLYIHAGTPKTGTSTFQRFLAHNSKKLNERGLFVPPFGVDIEHAHHPLAWSLFALKEDKPSKALRAQFWGVLERDQDFDILISSETIPNHIMEQDKSRLHMKALVERADDLGFEVIPIVVVRNPLDYHESAYSQMSKSFMAGESFEEYLFERTWNPTYIDSQVMVPLELNPDKNIVVPLNSQTRKSGIERELIKALGIEWDGLEPVARVNEGVGICQVAVGLALTQHFLTQSPVSYTQAHICGSVVARAVNKFLDKDPVYRPMTVDMAIEVEKAYSDTCQTLADRAWKKDWHDVFDSDAELRRSVTIDHFAYRHRYVPAAWNILLRSYAEVFSVLTNQDLINRFADDQMVPPRKGMQNCALREEQGFSMSMVESQLSKWGYAIAS